MTLVPRDVREACAVMLAKCSKETVPFICVRESICGLNDPNVKFPHWEHEGLSPILGHPTQGDKR